jgi:hypothetical protein
MNIQNKKILLVGGSGFIGHNLALYLKGKNANPYIVDSLSINNLYSLDNEEIINKNLYSAILNNRIDLFMQMTEGPMDHFLTFGAQLGMIPPGSEEKMKQLQKTNEIRRKFLSRTMRYEKNPTKFFEDEFEEFNYVANKMLKKISKLYAMAKDDEQVSESILNWDLHQQIMEKKYGKRKIETKYKNWNLK